MLVTIDKFWSWMKQSDTKQSWDKNFIQKNFLFCSQGSMVLLFGSLSPNLYLVKQALSLASKHLQCWSQSIIFGHECNKAIQNKNEMKFVQRKFMFVIVWFCWILSQNKLPTAKIKSSEIELLQGTLTEGEGSLLCNKWKYYIQYKNGLIWCGYSKEVDRTKPSPSVRFPGLLTSKWDLSRISDATLPR